MTFKSLKQASYPVYITAFATVSFVFHFSILNSQFHWKFHCLSAFLTRSSYKGRRYTKTPCARNTHHFILESRHLLSRFAYSIASWNFYILSPFHLFIQFATKSDIHLVVANGSSFTRYLKIQFRAYLKVALPSVNVIFTRDNF